MRTIRKILSLVLVGMLILSACALAEDVTINFWHHYSAQSAENETLMNVLIPAFEADNPGIKVNAVSHEWAELHDNIRWLDTRWSGLTVAMILGIWKGIGWNMVIFLAALQQVPKDLYEAADIDGCGAWKKFVYVTLPGIRGTILFALIELTIGGFNVFTSIKMITGGKPAHQTDTLLTWMYYKAFSTGQFGYAAALSFVMALSLGLLAIVQFRMMRNRDA